MTASLPASGWSRAAGAFRLAFFRNAPHPRKQTVGDIRWSLDSNDPSISIFSGSFAASDRANVPYRLWPAGKPKAVAILLHGAFDYSGAFDELGPKFASHGIAALAIDQRGFGATRSRRHWCGRKRMAKDVADAVAFIRTRYSDLPIFIVGESMGAAVAVHAVANAPGLDVAGLVLSAPGAISGLFRRFFMSSLIKVLNVFAPRSEITIERLSANELTPSSAIRLLFDPLVLRGVRPRMAFGLFDIATTAVEAANKVNLPTLTMVGSKEDFLSAGCIEHLHKSFAGEKTWREFEDGPHLLLHWRHCDRVLTEVFSWLDAHIPETEAALDVAAS